MSEILRSTLANKKWLLENENNLKDLLPKVWTHINNLNGLQIGLRLKLIGVDWRSQDEFANVMIYLEKIGIMIRRNGYQVRANPAPLFN
jgi:hypothetical protein